MQMQIENDLHRMKNQKKNERGQKDGKTVIKIASTFISSDGVAAAPTS
jgi:hypothetical protein